MLPRVDCNIVGGCPSGGNKRAYIHQVGGCCCNGRRMWNLFFLGKFMILFMCLVQGNLE
jgi:hypothetical protein